MTTFAHQGNGKLIKGPDGKLAKDCECCEDCPTDCSAIDALVTDGVGWRIAGYTDGLFNVTGCPDLVSGVGFPVWSGEFTNLFSSCVWIPADEMTAGGGNIQISGYKSYPSTAEPIQIAYNTVTGTYNLQIWLLTNSTPQWIGTKSADTCNTYAGIYTKTSGCAVGPSSVEIEAAP